MPGDEKTEPTTPSEPSTEAAKKPVHAKRGKKTGKKLIPFSPKTGCSRYWFAEYLPSLFLRL